MKKPFGELGRDPDSEKPSVTCYQTKGMTRACQKCGVKPFVAHMAEGLGYFCEMCCPICRPEKSSAKE